MTTNRGMTQQEIAQQEEDFNKSFGRTIDITSMDGDNDFSPIFFDGTFWRDEQTIGCILEGSPSKPELREFRRRNPEGYENYCLQLRREMGVWYEDYAKEFLL